MFYSERRVFLQLFDIPARRCCISYSFLMRRVLIPELNLVIALFPHNYRPETCQLQGARAACNSYVGD